jgi:ADP-ribosylglycohydrolase/catechol 2,3-dioxygenase-like lactoylglutathione lyase family enzyme
MESTRPSVVSGATDTGGGLSRPTERAQAAMLSAACGDALGWPVEPRGQRVGGTASLQPQLSFIEWIRREGGGYAPFQRRVPPGAYSDDTQLMLAVARSLCRGEKWWDHLTRFELPAWTLYELGGGGAVKRAAQGWSKGRAPWQANRPVDRQRYFAAGANGVAMRILPHAIIGADDSNFDAVRERIVADGLTTHGHPRALVGALAAGYATWTALRWSGKVGYGELIEDCLAERQAWSRIPESSFAPDWKEAAAEHSATAYEEDWRLASEEMAGLLSLCREAIARGSLARDQDVLEELGAFGKENGSGTRTAAVAIYLASRYVANPAAGLLASAFARRADTDTIACVTGGILGAFSGDDRVDGLADDLLDGAYIHRLASQVASREVDPDAIPAWTPRTKSKVLDQLSELPHGEKIALPLFGESVLVKVERPETKSANEVTIWWLTTQLGQTLAVTKLKKVGERVSAPRNTLSRSGQMQMGAAEESEAGRARVTWNFLFVRDFVRALRLYNEVLGIPIVRTRSNYAILDGHLVLERSDQQEPTGGKDLRAPQVVGVFVGPGEIQLLRERIIAAGYNASEVGSGRNGRRFRLQDDDGHVIEVFTSPPSP